MLYSMIKFTNYMVHQISKEIIYSTFVKNNRNISATARELKINRLTLINKMKKFDLYNQQNNNFLSIEEKEENKNVKMYNITLLDNNTNSEIVINIPVGSSIIIDIREAQEKNNKKIDEIKQNNNEEKVSIYNNIININKQKNVPICKIDELGTKRWYLNGILHRDNQPAVEWFGGNNYWYKDGKLHREDGPAKEYNSGYGEWFIEGKRHRIDGPAVYKFGKVSWWLDDIQYSEKDWTNIVSKSF